MTALVRAEQIPAKSYTAADGLAHDQVHRIFQDSRGFLRLATDDGLSGLDARRFTTYNVLQRAVNGLRSVPVRPVSSSLRSLLLQ